MINNTNKELKGGTKMEETIDKKEIGNYKVRFKTHFKKEDSDYIYLDIAISDDLQNFLKGICVLNEETETTYHDGNEYKKFKRYLVRKPFYNILEGRQGDLLFHKTLITKGEVKIQITDVQLIDTFISSFKENLKNLIKNVLQYSDLDITLNINLKK